MSFQNYFCHFPSVKYNDHYLVDIKEALKNKQPYSWIRIGDGELVFLQQEYVRPIHEILATVGWASGIGYCGATIPNTRLRDRMIEAIKNSSMVGIFQGDPPTMEALEKINVAPDNICYAFDNVFLPMNADYVNILLKYKILLVGQKSQFYAQKFKEILNVDVVGTVGIDSYDDIDECMYQMAQYDYELALVSAGVNAKVICYEMSTRNNKVFLDMGHAWDNAFHPKGMYDEYWLIPAWQDKYFQPGELAIYDNKLYKNTCNEILNSNPVQDPRWLVLENL
jgi:hypothetical protein